MSNYILTQGINLWYYKFRKTKNLDSLRVYINPVIRSVSKKKIKGSEGCGSVASANLFGMVDRPVLVVVEALDREGRKFTLKASNLLARVIQHETDHLNGVLFVDTSDPKTYMSRNEYFKMVAKKK